jgi:hypothetical protein
MSLKIADFVKLSSNEELKKRDDLIDNIPTGVAVSGLTKHQTQQHMKTAFLSLTWSKRGKKSIVSEETLMNVLSVYGVIKKVIMGTGARKTAIVEFEKHEDAAKAKDALNGVICADAGGKTFHIEFAVLRKAYEVIKTEEHNARYDRCGDNMGLHVGGLQLRSRSEFR